MRILLVEDYLPDALLLTEWLLEAGITWDIVQAETFAQAEQEWQLGTFDALLLDFNIPDGYGLELLERGLKLARDVPVIVLSGLEDETVAANAIGMGAKAYLIKGYQSVPKLVAILRELVDLA
jgi:DNA-binding response OmpR family regulator